MRKKAWRVLLVLGWYDYRLQRGIEQYAQEHGWHLSPQVTREKVIPWGWDGDGILAWLGAGDDLADFVVHARKPTVDFSFRRPYLRFPRVLFDHTQAAQLVAEHFLTRGFTNFLFYSDYRNWSFDERGTAFVECLRQAGYSCRWLRWSRPSASDQRARYEEWHRKRKWLVAELKRMPKPLAAFAGADWMAMDLMESCESAQLRVPEEVAIVAPDNSFLAVESMSTPISSVEPNMETMGYRGAALLDDLMNGKPPPKQPIRMPPLGVIVRKSSDMLAVNHSGVAEALRFLWEHYHEPVHVGDMAKAAGMSLRGLQKAFLEHIGRSPRDELHRIRIDHAKKLLTMTGKKTETVASECGYPNLNSFWVSFRNATGIPPAQYRKEFGHLR
ncbi:MAG TPA: DNA-binding transcriptional regulator [Verrucomicrobiae bacterium]|nr:DNA-binding transcriptional regulator [Verrucomicrobiae bacterium]